MAALTPAPRLAPLILMMVVASGLALHEVYLARAGAHAVYMDTLRLLWQLSEFQLGRLPLVELWGHSGGPHSGLVFQAVLAANVSWFGLDPLLANRLTGLVMAMVALLLCGGYIKDSRRAGTSPPILRFSLFIAATTVLCFSLSGFEVLTLDLGLGLWLKNLLIFVLFFAHARTLRGDREPTLAWVSSVSAYGVFVVLVCAMGWSYAVVGAIVGVQVLHHGAARTWPTAKQAALPLALVCALVAATLGKRWYFGDGGHQGGSAFELDSLRQWLLSLASTFMNGETSARLGISPALLLALGALLAAGIGVATVVRVLDRRAPLVPVHLMAYASLCALSFVMARGGAGDDAVMASRYHMDLFPGLVGILWVASSPMQAPLKLPAWVMPGAFFGLVGLLAGFQARQASVEWSAAPYRKAALSAMNEALLAGVPNEAAANLLQSPMPDARRAVAVMRQQRLGVFRNAPQQPVAATSCATEWVRREGWHAGEAGGSWSSARAGFEVPACPCRYEVALYIPESFEARTVAITRTGGTAPTNVLALEPGKTVLLSIPAAAAPHRYQLVSSETTIPAREGINDDTRELGVLMGQPQAICDTGR
ncbi:MAG: hypothetical protein EOP93_00485 [Lysobacteraceae bacterium]|nr:MAG: hypothetical protein EOP93_00485 [Xanthomonadaceae bacterium]